MSTYKDIITDCLNNDKVIPPRIRLNIYNKILKYFLNNNSGYICIELKRAFINYNVNLPSTNFYYKSFNNNYKQKDFNIYFPEFNRNLIFKNSNLFNLIKHSGLSWFYTMQDRITFVKFMIDIVNKEIINNKRSKRK